MPEHTLFIDPREARDTAARAHPTREADGEERRQVCYYLAPQLEHPTLTLIGVPFTGFSDLFAHTSLPLPTRIQFPQGLDPTEEKTVEGVFHAMTEQLRELRQRQDEARLAKAGGDFRPDTYFLDSLEAFAQARLQARVRLHDSAVFGRQLCFYPGPAFADAPDTLIPLPLTELANFFFTSRLRLPATLFFPHTMPEEERQGAVALFEAQLRRLLEEREREHLRLLQTLPTLAPEPVNADGKLRILLPASRYTTVMQYATQGLAKAFADLGHTVRVMVETDGREQLDSLHYLREHQEFRPQVTVHINHRNSHHLHPEVVNVIWYQDPMPELMTASPLPWRPRDVVMAINSEIAGYIRACGQEAVTLQPPCYDQEVFRLYPDEVRKPGVVFVGSAYNYVLEWATLPHFHDVLAALEAEMTGGGVLDEGLAQRLAEHYRFDFHRIWPHMSNYTVRDLSVRWLCANTTTPVAVYGRFWERDPVVAPFFKGELPHGEPVARAYNRATYALTALIKTVNSQRLAELAACGCIPLVYDARPVSDPPHWDDHCLFYQTREELHRLLDRQPARDPQAIARAFRYDTLARNILTRIQASDP